MVNTLRLLGRRMRKFTIPNRSSVPMEYKEFDEAGRMCPSAYFDRTADVMEELGHGGIFGGIEFVSYQ